MTKRYFFLTLARVAPINFQCSICAVTANPTGATFFRGGG